MILGSVSVFERDGVYQIYVKAMQEDGVGNLYREFEKLKKKLELEGLFDINHKKQIPFFPKIIGVLSSNTGAVIRDIINVSTRRNPNVYIRLFPVPVQGEGAGQKIADAIKFMNEKNLADVLIIARGGGSLEDLWPFNEELVARAIYESQIPIISAVGHETDFTISDFVADLRAPTPSAAAELAVPNINDLREKIFTYNLRYKESLRKKIEIMRLKFEKCMSRKSFIDPLRIVNDKYLLVDNNIKKLENSIKNKLNIQKEKSIKLISKIDALSPLKTLTRGYCISYIDNKVVKSVNEVKNDDIIDINFLDGSVRTRVCAFDLNKERNDF